MVLPLVWLAMAAVGGAVSYFVNDNAKEKEEEALRIQRQASLKHDDAAERLSKRREALKLELIDRQGKIRDISDECAIRAEPVLVRYRAALAKVTDWPMPPGFEKIEEMNIPARPGDAVAADIKEKGERTLQNGVNMMLQYGSHNFRGKDLVGDFSRGAAFAGAQFFTNALTRQTNAEKAITDAAAFSAKVDAFVAEAGGLRTTFGKLTVRADMLLAKAEAVKPFFDRYIAPCEEIYRTGRPRSRLRRREWLTVQYLARVQACLNAIVQEPLA